MTLNLSNVCLILDERPQIFNISVFYHILWCSEVFKQIANAVPSPNLSFYLQMQKNSILYQCSSIVFTPALPDLKTLELLTRSCLMLALPVFKS